MGNVRRSSNHRPLRSYYPGRAVATGTDRLSFVKFNRLPDVCAESLFYGVSEPLGKVVMNAIACGFVRLPTRKAGTSLVSRSIATIDRQLGSCHHPMRLGAASCRHMPKFHQTGCGYDY
jgi:hypothetical protein